ncbi:MAG: pur operon repressor, partial [Eubacteriales bacterium]|nr:pur operon repressor [Eubacteriales bacterium]
MEKIKRNERVIAMLKILTNSPNKSITLNYFSELFSAAKSTVSEDIDIVREVLEKYSLGTLETVTGAAGGVMYISHTNEGENHTFLQKICAMMQDPARVLPGGFLYVTDVLNDPTITARMGEIIAGWYYSAQADFVLTVETMGIPVALRTARTLGVPLIIARRDARITDGSVVTINYLSGSS